MFSSLKISIILKTHQIKNTFTAILLLWITGLFFSRFLQSVATIISCFVFLLGEEPKRTGKASFKNGFCLAFFVIFAVYLLSIFNSENKAEYFNILKNKIPFIFLPLSLLAVKELDKRSLQFLRIVFVACCLVSSLWSYIHYLQDIPLYTKLYTQGEVMPTLIHHVSLSFLLCISVLFLLDDLLHSTSSLHRLLYFTGICWFIYFIHVLSVRTGIALLYLSILLFAFSLLISFKKPLFSIGLLILMVISAYVSYQKIPTLKSKIAYTDYSVHVLKENNDTMNVVSDTRRFLSDKIGIELIWKNKLSGVGIGDIETEMNTIYKTRFPGFKEEVYAHIHNQYLYTICGVGLILGILFCASIFYPFIYFIKHANWLFSIVYALLLCIMMWEPFIQNQLGTSIFLVLSSIGFLSTKKT